MNSEQQKVDHLRDHLTDGHWHDECRWCLQRRVTGGTGVPTAGEVWDVWGNESGDVSSLVELGQDLGELRA